MIVQQKYKNQSKENILKECDEIEKNQIFSKNEIAKITYGMELPEQYKTKMEESAACGQAIIQATLAKYKGTGDSTLNTDTSEGSTSKEESTKEPAENTQDKE